MDREFMAIIADLLNDIWTNANTIQYNKERVESLEQQVADLKAVIESDRKSVDILNRIVTSSWAINSLLSYAVLFDNFVYFYMGDRLIRVSKSTWYNEVSTRDSYTMIEIAGE